MRNLNYIEKETLENLLAMGDGYVLDFRNYIHPNQEVSSKFPLDRVTAEICLQVLKLAVSDLSKLQSGQPTDF